MGGWWLAKLGLNPEVVKEVKSREDGVDGTVGLDLFETQNRSTVLEISRHDTHKVCVK